MSKVSKKKFRAVSGILLFDKPLGLSSNQALQKVRYLFQAAKAGHTGSLDPLATGVLPICFGEATKFSQYLLDAEKTYLTRAQLGVTTTTGDAEGTTLQIRSVPTLDESFVLSILAGFLGEITQIPPMYSALKHQGRPLYELARQGQEVARAERQVFIKSLDLVALGNDFLELRVHCSKGTYIRTLVEDIGESLGCGAHVTMLRRERTAGFDLSQCHELEQLQKLASIHEGESESWENLDSLLLPMDAGIADWPAIQLDQLQSHSILLGQTVKIQPGQNSGLVRLFSFDGEFVGLGQLAEDRLKPHRLVSRATAEQS